MTRDEIAFEVFKLLTESEIETVGDQREFCRKVVDIVERGLTSGAADGWQPVPAIPELEFRIEMSADTRSITIRRR